MDKKAAEHDVRACPNQCGEADDIVVRSDGYQTGYACRRCGAVWVEYRSTAHAGDVPEAA